MGTVVWRDNHDPRPSAAARIGKKYTDLCFLLHPVSCWRLPLAKPNIRQKVREPRKSIQQGSASRGTEHGKRKVENEYVKR